MKPLSSDFNNIICKRILFLNVVKLKNKIRKYIFQLKLDFCNQKYLIIVFN